MLTLQFKDKKNGQYKTIMTYAKIARGMMASYIIKNQIIEQEKLKNFNQENYQYNPSLSTEQEWVYTR